MAKNPNGKSMKRDNSLYGATLFFLAACLAECYLLVLRKYYIHGDVVTEALVWYDRLLIFAGLGAAVLVLGVILSVLWKGSERKRIFGWALSALGGFFAVGSMLARIYVEPAVTLLSVVVPVLMVLTVIWAFYDRECSVALTALCGTRWVLAPHLAATGLSAVAVVLALFSATVAYYAMWVLGIVVFALAVYYTVKQL